jgi:hypothetical protein
MSEAAAEKVLAKYGIDYDEPPSDYIGRYKQLTPLELRALSNTFVGIHSEIIEAINEPSGGDFEKLHAQMDGMVKAQNVSGRIYTCRLLAAIKDEGYEWGKAALRYAESAAEVIDEHGQMDSVILWVGKEHGRPYSTIYQAFNRAGFQGGQTVDERYEEFCNFIDALQHLNAILKR